MSPPADQRSVETSVSRATVAAPTLLPNNSLTRAPLADASRDGSANARRSDVFLANTSAAKKS